MKEDEELKDSENPDKILVKNKKSGQSYYINKDSFNPTLHIKPESKDGKDEDDTSGDKPGEKKDAAAAGGVDLMAGAMAGMDAGKSSDKKDDKKDDKNKLEKKLGSRVFLKDMEKKNIIQKTADIRPDLKTKLLAYDYTSLFSEYNNLQVKGADQKELDGVSKKIQTVALAKFSAVSTMENDENTVKSALIYHSNATEINNMLRKGDKLISKKEIEKQLASKENPKELKDELKKTLAIYDIDEHFNTSGARLENDVTVYRAVHKDAIEKFVKAKRWIDSAFVSTTLNPVITEDKDNDQRNTLFKIHLKRGDSVLILSESEDPYCIETEITLPRGCTFILGNYDKVKNSYDVYVEYPDAYGR